MAYDGLSELKAKRRSRPTRVIPPPSNPRHDTEVETPTAPEETVSQAQADTLNERGAAATTQTATVEESKLPQAQGDSHREVIAPPLPRSASGTSSVKSKPVEPASKVPTPKQPETSASDLAHTRQLLVYLYPAVREAARMDANRRSVSNASIALDAVDACHENLGNLIKERSVDVRADSLFGARRRVPSRRKVAGRGQARIPWSLQLLDDDIEVLQRLEQTHKASSISEVLSVALEHKYGDFVELSDS